MTARLVSLCLVPALLLGGCLDREEQITVLPDGRVDVLHRVRGDASDFDDGLAGVPGPPELRVVAVERTEGARRIRTLTATGSYARVAALPTSLGTGPGALRLRTDLETEETADGGLAFTLTRTYQARRWAAYTYPPEPALLDGLRRVADGSATPEQRAEVVDALTRAERRRCWQLALDALEDVVATHPARTASRLAASAAIERHLEAELGPATVLELLRAQPEDARARLSALRAKLEEQLALDVASALDLGAERQGALRDALAARRHALEVTEDLGDEQFVVRLRLPGELTAHNGDAVEDGAVVWRISGRDLWDRDHVLIARSETPPGR